jgi:cell wall-associated NlpC family hydrolase
MGGSRARVIRRNHRGAIVRIVSVRSFHRLFLCVLLLGTGLVLTAAAVDDDDAAATSHSRKKKTSSGQATPKPHASPSAHKKGSDDDDADSSEKRAGTGTPHQHGTPSHKKAHAEDDDAEPAGRSTPRPHGSPAGHRKASADDEEAPASSTPSHRKKASADEESDTAKPAATPGKKARSEEGSGATGKESTGETKGAPGAAPSDVEANPSGTGSKYAPSASIASSELTGFNEQPPKVKQLIESALALAKLNLTYKFGSDDPANGGMDCSGTVAYLLRQQGFTDVPRDASGQYTWVRKKGLFYAVISKKAGGFEFADLLPGDLMFWNGTYNADRDPPVTHTMIYLGVERKRKQPVMWGSSDGRSYDGKQRYGVSVFDFRMPRIDSPNASGQQADFLGYARIPGLRDAAE